MTFTGQLGTKDSSPGNIAIGQSVTATPVTGGAAPRGAVQSAVPTGRSSSPVPSAKH